MPNYKNAVGPPTEVRNRRLKISPAGIVTLPVAARKALGMERGRGARVTVANEGKSVILEPAGPTGGFRVSPAGQLELRAEAKAVLEGGAQRHFWIELSDEKRQVVLRPCE